MDLTNFEKIIDELKDKLSRDDLDLIKEFLDHNEWGIAYKHVCIQLSEFDIPITKELYENIENFGKLIGIEDAYWLSLQDLIIKK